MARIDAVTRARAAAGSAADGSRVGSCGRLSSLRTRHGCSSTRPRPRRPSPASSSRPGSTRAASSRRRSRVRPASFGPHKCGNNLRQRDRAPPVSPLREARMSCGFSPSATDTIEHLGLRSRSTYRRAGKRLWHAGSSGRWHCSDRCLGSHWAAARRRERATFGSRLRRSPGCGAAWTEHGRIAIRFGSLRRARLRLRAQRQPQCPAARATTAVAKVSDRLLHRWSQRTPGPLLQQ